MISFPAISAKMNFSPQIPAPFPVIALRTIRGRHWSCRKIPCSWPRIVLPSISGEEPWAAVIPRGPLSRIEEDRIAGELPRSHSIPPPEPPRTSEPST